MSKVVVVGGGYAGSLIAKQLDEVAEVVLVDPRDAFVNVAASLRAVTQPEWAPHAFFAYADLLEHGTIVRDTVTSVDAQGVELASGARIDADYVVLATGSTYPYPAHPRRLDESSSDALTDLRATHHELETAETVLIVGAGPVGLELAGEIRQVWPDKPVTVVARGERLLPAYLPELHAELVQQLAALGVDLRLSTTLQQPPAGEPGMCESFSVVTSTGDVISADIWFRGYGARVNTDYLRDGRLVELTAQGMVPVTDALAVVGVSHVYAVGDIADLPDLKMATHAQTQATTVVDNVKAQIEGRPASAVYEPARVQRIFLPLGAEHGSGQVPGPDGVPRLAPLEVVRDRKGRDLFTSQLRRRFDREPSEPRRCEDQGLLP